MIEKLRRISDRYEEITGKISSPEVIQDTQLFQKLSKEHSKLRPVADLLDLIEENDERISSCLSLLENKDEDKEILDLAKEELAELEKRKTDLEKDLQIKLLPENPDDSKNCILEIRAGTGGDEAALFAADIYKMYRKFAEKNRWKFEVMDSNLTGIGGFKEVICLIEGEKAYSKFKYEAGTHRVQRVPQTETQGRVHTSAITVAVLPEAEEVEVNINPADLKIDVYRSQGAGGQHVNTTDSAVRITHIPSGIVVTCQEERSQIKNKAKAMKYLKAKLFEQKQKAVSDEEAETRRIMVGSGDRSERIRTYNFPQGRITDHRIKMTLYQLEEIINTGDIDELIAALASSEQAEKLKRSEESI